MIAVQAARANVSLADAADDTTPTSVSRGALFQPADGLSARAPEAPFEN